MKEPLLSHSLRERLLIAFHHFGLSISELAKICSMSYPTVQAMVNGRADFNDQIVFGLLKAYPVLRMEWLLFGRSPMLTHTNEESFSVRIEALLHQIKYHSEEDLHYQLELVAELINQWPERQKLLLLDRLKAHIS